MLGSKGCGRKRKTWSYRKRFEVLKKVEALRKEALGSGSFWQKKKWKGKKGKIRTYSNLLEFG